MTPLVSPALWFINKCEAGADCSAEHECFEGVAGRGLHINNQKQKKKKMGKKRQHHPRKETVPNAVHSPVALFTADSIKWQEDEGGHVRISLIIASALETIGSRLNLDLRMQGIYL